MRTREKIIHYRERESKVEKISAARESSKHSRFV